MLTCSFSQLLRYLVGSSAKGGRRFWHLVSAKNYYVIIPIRVVSGALKSKKTCVYLKSLDIIPNLRYDRVLCFPFCDCIK